MLFVIKVFFQICVILGSLLLMYSPAQGAIPAYDQKNQFNGYHKNINSEPKMITHENFQSQSLEQIPFYKSKYSQFPSGYASKEILSEKLLSKENNDIFYLEKNKQNFQLHQIPNVTAYHLSQKWIEKLSGRSVPADLNQNFENILQNYKTDPLDRGLILTLKKTILRKSPRLQEDREEKLEVTIPENYFLIPISFSKGFVEVIYKKKRGYLDMNDCISKFDFAQFVLPLETLKKSYRTKLTSKSWQLVTHREFDFLKTANDSSSIHLNKIKAFITNDRLAYSFKSVFINEKIQFPTWSQFTIQKAPMTHWVSSQHKNHGVVWWRQNQPFETTEKYITIDKLLSKKIFSVSFDAKKNQAGIISSEDGVYITEDGQYWKAIPQFKNYSGPVYYYSSKIIFIGSYRSFDGGKTFENYIQIDKIADAINNSTGQVARKIKLTQIKSVQPMKVVIEVTTGDQIHTLRSSLFAQNWKLSE